MFIMSPKCSLHPRFCYQNLGFFCIYLTTLQYLRLYSIDKWRVRPETHYAILPTPVTPHFYHNNNLISMLFSNTLCLLCCYTHYKFASCLCSSLKLTRLAGTKTILKPYYGLFITGINKPLCNNKKYIVCVADNPKILHYLCSFTLSWPLWSTKSI